MPIWRPANTIKVKALALIWQGDALLLSDIHDDSGRVTGMRPLGGAVEFDEPWRDTLRREFLEELGARIRLLDEHFVMENIYEHHGVTGHEVVFLCHAHFHDNSYYRMDSIVFETGEDGVGTARWITLDELAAKGLELYPAGLRERLASAKAAPLPGLRFS
jgi:ADP-ribose pyrophosphatase YjhB (NUDIX family)